MSNTSPSMDRFRGISACCIDQSKATCRGLKWGFFCADLEVVAVQKEKFQCSHWLSYLRRCTRGRCDTEGICQPLSSLAGLLSLLWDSSVPVKCTSCTPKSSNSEPCRHRRLFHSCPWKLILNYWLFQCAVCVKWVLASWSYVYRLLSQKVRRN